VDVRIVAATNKALEQAIKEGLFRHDLYYRLNVLPIHLPPLRERPMEIPHLAEHFLKKYSAEEGARKHTGLSPHALQKLMDYDWPGNIRELESVMYRASVVSREGEIGPSDVPLGNEESTQLFSVLEEKPFREAKAEVINRFEANYVARLLKITQGNVPQAADMAGQDRKSFWRIMTKHRIDPTRFR
jgi:DNA-binding NtrC family response regulator